MYNSNSKSCCILLNSIDRDGIGKEIITRYSTDFENNGEFYTDANGRQSIKRIKDTMQELYQDETEPVASNYYPVTTHIYMTDSKSGYRLNVITDRAQGGGSIENGQLELMLHRRLVQQDFCLFKEPLDETEHGKGLVVRGTHTLFFEDTKAQNNTEPRSSTLRSIVKERSSQSQISLVFTNYKVDDWLKFYRPKVYILNKCIFNELKTSNTLYLSFIVATS